jgi:hypothetical protein
VRKARIRLELTIFTTKFIDSAGGIHYFLLAGVKRMASGAHIEVKIVVG